MIYRQGRNYENLNKMIYRGTGKFDTPRLVPEACNADSFIGFNYAKSCKDPQHKGVHFFIDDYQFTRLWTNPDAYLDMLRAFKCVFTPDFSTYTDFPKAVQIWNHYRKHWLGAYWQSNGITVIPTISWSDESSFDWCFDGEPVGGIKRRYANECDRSRAVPRWLQGNVGALAALANSVLRLYSG